MPVDFAGDEVRVVVVRDRKLGWRWIDDGDPTILTSHKIDWDFWWKIPRGTRQRLLEVSEPGEWLCFVCEMRPVRFWHWSSRGYKWRLRVLFVVRVLAGGELSRQEREYAMRLHSVLCYKGK